MSCTFLGAQFDSGFFVKYYLPTIRSDKNGFTQLARLKDALSSSIDDELIIDFSKCKFFDANMAASLKAVLSSVTDSSKIIVINGLPQAVEDILRKNQFLNEYGYPVMRDTNQTTLPLLRVIFQYHCFQSSDSRVLDNYLNTHLSGKGIPKMSPMLNEKFRQGIFEIFENCAKHSDSNQGIFVCGQFFPRLNRLDLTISDAGIGIRTNVRRFLNKKVSSIDAIRWAMEEGNTTKTGSQPGGLGLALLKNLIELNLGKIQIISRQGYYEFSRGKIKFEKLDADFPGTTINLEINTNDNNSYCLRSEISAKDIF
jgi:signal transduction histidine kinase